MRLSLVAAAGLALALSAGCSTYRAPVEEGAAPGLATTAPAAAEGPPAPAAVAAPAPAEVTAGPAEGARPADPVLPVDRQVQRASRPARQWAHISTQASASCREDLLATGMKFRTLPDVKAPNRHGCGVPRGVLVTRGPSGIVYSPPLQVDCSFAQQLVDVERVIQEEAEKHLKSPIARLVTLGSYACRPVVGRLAGWSGGISEHSFGNAVDIARFEPKRGRAVSVFRDYQPGKPAEKAATWFLRSVARRLREEGAARRVLGPEFDASHADHLHLDHGTRWWQ